MVTTDHVETIKQLQVRPDVVHGAMRATHCIIVMSGKGGVGKSTISVNLAVSLSLNGYAVGLLDADLTSPSIPRLLGLSGNIEVQENQLVPISYSDKLKVLSTGFLVLSSDRAIVWRGGAKMGAIKQFINETKWGDLDFLIVDLPPGTSDEPLSIAQELQPDGALVVTTPQEVALVSSRKSVDFAHKLEVPIIGIVENMSGYTCPTCGTQVDIFKSGGGERSAKELGAPFICRIPLDAAICESGDSGKPISENSAKAPRASEGSDLITQSVLHFYGAKEKVKTEKEEVKR
ncbi:MAG: Mrp/NBP35 family ATP-binding protein [Halobacteriota archaeon]|jgi:Mrp family chromosome partitioning ATPase